MTNAQIAGMVCVCILSGVAGYCAGRAIEMREQEMRSLMRKREAQEFLASAIYKNLKSKPLWKCGEMKK